MKHTMVTWEDGGPRLDWQPVTITKWQPEEEVLRRCKLR